MEEIQQEIIKGVLCDVLKNMRYNILLRAKLVKDDLITQTEIEIIESKSTNTDKCACLIEFLLTRQDAFIKLYEALVEEKQSGAFTAIFNATKSKLSKEYELMVKINNKHQVSTDEIYFHHSQRNTDKFVSSEESKILIITTNTRELTTKKIKDTVPNVHVKTTKFFRKQPGIITLWTQISEIGKLLEKLLNSDGKHIVITNHSAEIVKEQVKIFCKIDNVVLTSIDTFSWTDLTENFQTKLLSHNVRHLNKLLTLEELFEKYEVDEDSLENLDEQFLIELINNENPSVFRNTIPSKPKYYVTRSIRSRCMLSLHKIEDFKNDIFLFTGFEQTDMTSYFKKMTNTASSQIFQKALTVQFIQLESESQFDLICELTAHPVHWIHNLGHELNGFIWIKSRGDITSIQKMIDHNNVHHPVPENEFSVQVFNSKYVTNFRSPVCIVDSPGMGKTELLANIGRSLQTEFPGHLVVFVRASDFTSKVKGQLTDGLQLTEEILNACVCEVVCGIGFVTNQVFQKYVKSDLTINFLLDGYDEIPYTNMNLAEDILKLFSYSQNNVRIFVSSRAQNLESLEKTLSVLAYNILPFSKDEQHNFLVSYWTHSFINNTTFLLDSSRLEQFTSQCLKNVDEQIPKCDREFAGIPLQCLLIGIVFQNSAWEYSKSGNHFSTWISTIGVHSVSDLFEKCIEVKFKDSVQKHQIVDFDTNECMYAHACHAIRLIFPDFPVQPSIEAKKLFKFGILEQITQTGEIQQFLHRTFAEYLVSWVAVAHLQGQKHNYISLEADKLILNLFETSESFRKFTFHKHITFDFIHWMCLYFVNQKFGELRTCTDVCKKIKGISFDHCIRHMALACATSDFIHLLHLFVKIQNPHLHQAQFVESLLVNSVCFANLSLIQFVCDYFEDICSSKIKYKLQHVTVEYKDNLILLSLLHLAVEHGKYDVVEYLCKEKGFTRLVKSMILNSLAHSLAANTRNHDENKIQQKLKILKYLCNLNSNVLTESNKNNEPMFTYDTHPLIVRQFFHLMVQYSCFVSPVLSVYVLLPDEDMKLGNSIFSNIFSGLHQAEPQEKLLAKLKILLIHLLTNKIKLSEKLLKTSSAFMNLNALFDLKTKTSILSYQKLSETTNVEYLKQLQAYGVNFSIVCDSGQNLLHMLSPLSSVPFLCFMIESGVSVNLQDQDGNTPLHNTLSHEQCSESIIKTLIDAMLPNVENGHILWTNILNKAVKHGNSLAVTILLEKVSHKILNYSDPLYNAMTDWKHDTAKQTEIVENLIKYGGDINYLTENINIQQKINSGECTITFPILERLVSRGFKFNDVAATNTLVNSIGDKSNYDSKYKNRLFRYLLHLGADLYKVVEDGNTLLHKATQKGQLEYVQLLISNGLSPSCLNNFKQTPLHLEIEDKSKQVAVLETLVTSGGDLSKMDGNCRIALFQQMKFCKPNVTTPFVKLILPGISTLQINYLSEYCQLAEIMITGTYLGLGVSEHYVRDNNALLLHVCVQFNQTECIEELLTANPPLNVRDQDGNTPLHQAFLSVSTNLDIIRRLVKAGADLNIKNKLGYTPLECFRFEYDPCSYTETFNFLDIHLNNVPKVIVQNCLKTIKRNKSSSGLHFLSTLATEGINVLTHVEPNYIHECAQENALSLIRFVHSLGCDLTTKDTAGNTILHNSLKGEYTSPQHFHYLLDYMIAMGNDELLTIKNDANKTPIMCAVERFDVLECSLDLFKDIGVDFNFADNNQPPLIVAAVVNGRSFAFIKLLQKYGCVLESLTEEKWRYFGHEMVRDGKLTNFQMLIDIGYNVETRDENGNTLLHAAFSGNSKNISAAVDLLLENFADLQAKNNDGLTPCHMIAVLTATHFANEPYSATCVEHSEMNLETSLTCMRNAAVESLQPAKRLKPEAIKFEGVVCDGCSTDPIQMLRYKCLLCEDYDLCHDCISRDLHSNHIFAVVRSKEQNAFLKKFYDLNFHRIAAGWKYFHDEIQNDTSIKASWKITCSCCETSEYVKMLYMCFRCGYNQYKSCWKSCENTHFSAVVFSEKQWDTFYKLFRHAKQR